MFNDWTDRSKRWLGTLGGAEIVRSGVGDTEEHLVGLVRRGDVVELRIDGAAVATRQDASVAAADVSTPGTKVSIGGRPGLTHWVGGIWEIVAVKGAVDPAALATFEAYAKAKYGL